MLNSNPGDVDSIDGYQTGLDSTLESENIAGIEFDLQVLFTVFVCQNLSLRFLYLVIKDNQYTLQNGCLCSNSG